MSFQRILVPIDFSNDSLNAFQVALDRFAGPEHTLVLLHVVDPSGPEMQQPPEIRAKLVDDLRRLGAPQEQAWLDGARQLGVDGKDLG